jgi:hypothetical protein
VLGQPRLMNFVDLVRRRRQPMAMRAVSVAGLAPRRSRLGFRRPLGEWRRLPFAGALQLGDQLGQPRHLCFEFRNSTLEDLAIGTRHLGHAETLAKQHSFSCAC